MLEVFCSPFCLSVCAYTHTCHRECMRCKTFYIESENGTKSCLWHPGVSESHTALRRLETDTSLTFHFLAPCHPPCLYHTYIPTAGKFPRAACVSDPHLHSV